MTDIKNSAILEQILEYARQIGGNGRSAMTVERYLLAIIDYVVGKMVVDPKDESFEKTVNILTDNVSGEPDFESTRNELAAFINNNPDPSFIAGLAFQQRMYKAKELAKQAGLEELSPSFLLQCIFDDPDDFIKDHICKGKKPDQPVAEAVQDSLEKVEEKNVERNDESKCEPAADPRLVVEELTQKVRKIRDQLSEVVFGQEYAISVITSGYFQAELLAATDKARTRPAGTFLFAGPPGVGKTFLVNNFVQKLEMTKKFKSFDMSEYADPISYLDLIGYGNNYKSPQEGLLTGFVKRNPDCILLFDEIEKAHSTTLHLFLQILDQGELTDSKTNERVSFKDTLIFFTTNAGKGLYNAPDAYDFSSTPRSVVLKALQREINPYTKQPFFPAALCSRFAFGNVVMFNHMSARSLCRIAEAEINKQATNFEKEYGIKINFDRDVFTALLFAEGGNADARSLRGRAGKFFDDEIFELFRFMASDEHNGDISELELIDFHIELPENNEITDLFLKKDSHEVFIFSSNETINECGKKCEGINFVGSGDLESAKRSLSEKSFEFAIIDLFTDTLEGKKFINMEDYESEARDVFWYIREKFSGLPIYILQRDGKVLSKEEQKSYLREGVRGFVTLEDDNFSDNIDRICDEMYQQGSMKKLAAANRIVSFESGQSICDDGKTANITLFDFELTTAVDAEDTQNIMSNVSKPNVRFDSIIGAENAKNELRFFIEYLKDPKKFVESGLRAPKGVLLYGPPGTGKTMLAKAAATEAGVTFISAEGNQFIKRYLGEGKDDLHEIFAVARKYSPSILFIDEFEAIAKERRGGEHAFANGEDVLTALLTEMDGFSTDISRPVFVLAATNFDVAPGSGRSLDQALLRRFDSKIYVDLPNKEERIRFIKMKRSGSKAFDISDREIENIALRSTGMSLADLDSIMEFSLRLAIRKTEKKVTDQVFDEAFETFIGGEEKAWDASQLERTARHEAGHTFLCWHFGETPSYVTIVARGDHGGYMLHVDEGKQVFTKEELLAKIRTSLGGRAAEIVYYGDVDGLSTGAGADLASATSAAKRIVCSYGMDDDFGLAVLDQKEAQDGEMLAKVREAVNKILDQEMKNAIGIIKENRRSIDALVERLLSDNHLTGDEIKSVFEMSQRRPE